MQSQGLAEIPGDQTAERELRHLFLRGHLLKCPRCPRAAAGASLTSPCSLAVYPYIPSLCLCFKKLKRAKLWHHVSK